MQPKERAWTETVHLQLVAIQQVLKYKKHLKVLGKHFRHQLR